MVFHMKTTLNIDDGVMSRLKQEAARQGKTMSELVEIALRQLLQLAQEFVLTLWFGQRQRSLAANLGWNCLLD